MQRVLQEGLLCAGQVEPDVPGAERQRQAADQRAHLQGNDGHAGLHSSDPGPEQTSTSAGTLTHAQQEPVGRSSIRRDTVLVVFLQPPKKIPATPTPPKTQLVRRVTLAF